MPFAADGSFSLSYTFGTATRADSQFPNKVGVALDDIAASLNLTDVLTNDAVKTLAVQFGDTTLASALIGSATGGNRGAGSLNAVTLYLNGTSLGTASTKNVGVANGNVAQFDSVGYPAADGSQITGITGRLVAGTSLILNPYANSTTVTQAHGLSAQPALLNSYIECLTAEGGFSIGDRIYNYETNPPTIGSDATNTFLSISSGIPGVWNKSTHAIFNITIANWKAVVVPYKLV